MMTDPLQIKDIKQLESSHTRFSTMRHFLLFAWTEKRKTNGRLGNRKKLNFVLRINR